jgi:hypothetical protein
MTPDTDSMPLNALPQHKRKVIFDPTINLGHVLTFVGFVATGAIGYFDLRERIAVQESTVRGVSSELAAEKERNRLTLDVMREDVREIRRGVTELRSVPRSK